MLTQEEVKIKLDPQRIVKLYKDLNYTPCRGGFLHQPIGQTCLLGILYAEQYGVEELERQKIHWERIYDFGKELFDKQHITLYRAFDGIPHLIIDDHDQLITNLVVETKRLLGM